MRIELRLNNCRMEMECALCGSSFSLGDILGIAFDGHGELVGNVCDCCLQLTPQQLARLIASQATQMEAEAQALSSQAAAYAALAQEAMVLPTMAERQELERLAGR